MSYRAEIVLTFDSLNKIPVINTSQTARHTRTHEHNFYSTL